MKTTPKISRNTRITARGKEPVPDVQIISETESESEESERFLRLRSAYDSVKTRLLESEAEAEGQSNHNTLSHAL